MVPVHWPFFPGHFQKLADLLLPPLSLTYASLPAEAQIYQAVAQNLEYRNIRQHYAEQAQAD